MDTLTKFKNALNDLTKDKAVTYNAALSAFKKVAEPGPKQQAAFLSNCSNPALEPIIEKGYRNRKEFRGIRFNHDETTTDILFDNPQYKDYTDAFLHTYLDIQADTLVHDTDIQQVSITRSKNTLTIQPAALDPLCEKMYPVVHHIAKQTKRESPETKITIRTDENAYCKINKADCTAFIRVGYNLEDEPSLIISKDHTPPFDTIISTPKYSSTHYNTSMDIQQISKFITKGAKETGVTSDFITPKNSANERETCKTNVTINFYNKCADNPKERNILLSERGVQQNSHKKELLKALSEMAKTAEQNSKQTWINGEPADNAKALIKAMSGFESENGQLFYRPIYTNLPNEALKMNGLAAITADRHKLIDVLRMDDPEAIPAYNRLCAKTGNPMIITQPQKNPREIPKSQIPDFMLQENQAVDETQYQ